MPIPPSEIGSNLDKTNANKWMRGIDKELALEDVSKRYVGYKFLVPLGLTEVLIKWVCSEYEKAGWETDIDREDNGTWLKLYIYDEDEVNYYR